MRKYGKIQSITTDTRPSHSYILNNNALNKSANSYLAMNIQESQNKQLQFLKIKNNQLNEKMNRMCQHIQELEKNKIQILDINAKYVKVINKYYRDSNNKQNTHSNHKQSDLLMELQKQHRNLTKHCLVMERQIQNYVQEMMKYNILKSELHSVNHTNCTQLINQLRDLSEQNKYLRKQNNRISYSLEKSKLENQNYKDQNILFQGEANNNQNQIEKMRALTNTIKQQSRDQSNKYESKIYELQIKVQKLQKQLRKDQQWLWRNSQCKQKLQIQQIQYIHENNKLKRDLSQILDPKKKPFLDLKATKAKQVSCLKKNILAKSSIFD